MNVVSRMPSRRASSVGDAASSSKTALYTAYSLGVSGLSRIAVARSRATDWLSAKTSNRSDVSSGSGLPATATGRRRR